MKRPIGQLSIYRHGTSSSTARRFRRDDGQMADTMSARAEMFGDITLGNRSAITAIGTSNKSITEDSSASW